MSIYHLRIYLLLLIASLYIKPAMATETYFSGYATLGAACFSSDHTDFFRDEQPEGPGQSATCDLGLDSLLGVQLDSIFNDKLEAGFQATSYRDPENSFKPKLTLAQLRWRLDKALMLRVGRTHNPNFLHSEYRNVHYAMLTARPPTEVYNLLASYVFDGLELIYNLQAGSGNIELHGAVGNSDFDAYWSESGEVDPIEVRDGKFFGVSYEEGGFRFKTSFTTGKVTYLPDGLTPLSTALSANEMHIDDRDLQLIALGFRYDNNQWVYEAELAERKIDGWLQDQKAYYLTIARRLSGWTPYLTLARRISEGPKPNLTDLDPVSGNPIAALRSSSYANRSSIAFGGSFEMGETTQLKAQLDYILPENNSWADFINTEIPGYNLEDPDKETLISVNLNILF